MCRKLEIPSSTQTPIPIIMREMYGMTLPARMRLFNFFKGGSNEGVCQNRERLMMTKFQKILRTLGCAAFSLSMLAPVSSASAADYVDALKDVKQVKAVFDYTQKSAAISNILVWPIQNVYTDESVNSLPNSPMAAVVFHGPAVKLLSTDASHHEGQDAAEVKKFQEALTKMREEGVKLEVCSYALKVLKVDPESVIPAITKVPNGFVSVVGYQAQGYEVVRIP